METVHTTVLTLLVLLYALVEKDSTSLLMAGLVLVIMHLSTNLAMLHDWTMNIITLPVSDIQELALKTVKQCGGKPEQAVMLSE